MTEGVFSRVVSSLLGKETNPDKEVLGDGGTFTIKPGEVVYIGKAPSITGLWVTYSGPGRKRQITIEDKRIQPPNALSRCALRITIDPDDGYIIADKEIGGEGKSGSNDVYVWYMDKKGKWTKDRLIGRLPDNSWASYQESTGHPPIFDIITNDGNTVRLNFSGKSSGDQGVNFVEYQIQVNPESIDRPIRKT